MQHEVLLYTAERYETWTSNFMQCLVVTPTSLKSSVERQRTFLLTLSRKSPTAHLTLGQDHGVHRSLVLWGTDEAVLRHGLDHEPLEFDVPTKNRLAATVA